MRDCPYILFYVENTQVSETFYSRLLGLAPVEKSPTFVLYVLESGVKLGLWARDLVQPAASLTGGGGEVAFSLTSAEDFQKTHQSWQQHGVHIAQEPTDMDFGRTFLGLDPDGHRLRVFLPASAM